MNSLLDLLPKGGASIVDSLANETKFFRRFLFLIQEAEEGIQHFLKGDLFHFDPHVGDTACQIRAYYFALLWTKRKEVFPSLEKDLTQLKTYAEKMTILMDQCSRNLHRPLRPTSLDIFLEKLGVDLKLSEQGLILTISHLLSKYRWVDEEGISQTINEFQIESAALDTGTFIKTFVRHLQQRLSEISTDFVKAQSLELVNEKVDFYSHPEVLNCLYQRGDFNRSVYPCLATVEVIVKSIQYVSKIPIALLTTFDSVNTTAIFIFLPNQKGIFDLKILSDLDPNQPIFLVRGITLLNKETFLKKFSEIKLENIVIAYAAEHPQYSGLKLANICMKDYLKMSFIESYAKFYLSKLNQAEKLNISLKNKDSLFFYIKHFCLDRVENILNTTHKLPKLRLNLDSTLEKLYEQETL